MDGDSEARSVSGGEPIGPADEGIDGVEAFEVTTAEHTEDDLAYDHVPSVGGEHFPVPATCGFYEAEPPPDEFVVHSLEHGAIWIAYSPDLDEAQVAALRDLASRQAKVIVTPHDGLEAPIVATAWTRQLTLDSVDDPRLQQFIEQYRDGPNAPEPGAACEGAGEPAVASSTT
jgi:hypothetical protein